MLIKADPTIIKSTKIYFKSHIPYRYTLRYLPTALPSFPYAVHRENMLLVGDTWEPSIRYWASFNTAIEAAEKEYQKKIDSEGSMG